MRALALAMACALAVGIYANAGCGGISPAIAANVPIEPVDRGQLQEELERCWIRRYSGFDFSTCVRMSAPFAGADVGKSDMIDVIWTCAAQDNPLCILMLAYIKEHWGVEASLGRVRP